MQIAGGASGGQQLRREMAVIPGRSETEQRTASRTRPNGAAARRHGREEIKEQRHDKKLQRRFQSAHAQPGTDDVQQGDQPGEEKTERQRAQGAVTRALRPPARQRDEGSE